MASGRQKGEASDVIGVLLFLLSLFFFFFPPLFPDDKDAASAKELRIQRRGVFLRDAAGADQVFRSLSFFFPPSRRPVAFTDMKIANDGRRNDK